MVSAADVLYRKSNNSGRGESMSSTNIVTGTENNYFDDVTEGEQDGGHTEYRVFYVTNDHATENMDDVDIWLSEDNKNSAFSTISWAIDPIAQHPIWPFRPYVYLDGTNDEIDLGNHTDLWSLGLTKFSFSFWIWPTAAGDGNDRVVFDHGGAAAHGIRCIIDTASSVRIRFLIKNAANATFTAHSDSLNLYQWNFIVCVYDNTLGSANLKIYVNNILGAQTASLTETINLNASAFLGDTSTDYQGYIKDFRWFTTTALSTSQIDDIFLGESDAVGASYWLKMEEGTGNPVDTIAAKTTTLINGAEWRTSQEIASSTTEPLGINWQGVTNGPLTNTPNLGVLTANEGRDCPVWVKWVVADTDQDAADDYCVFTVQGKIPQGGTSPGGEGDPAPPPTPTNFTFVVCGDWGTESMTEDVVDLISTDPEPEIVISTGDCAYDSGSGAVDDFLDIIDPIDNAIDPRFETAFGNHDNAESESDSNETALKNHFGYSKTYHMFDYQNVRFIAIDNTTETSFGSGSTQYNQIKSWLQEGRSNSAIKWIIVYAHKPMFGNSSEHGYNSGNFNQAYFPLFDQYQVDLMCFGHNHHMAQSAQVKYNSSNATEPTIIDSSTPYVGGAGRIQIISGAGGHDADDLYEMDDGDDIVWVNDTDHGALFVTITNSGSTSTLTGVFKSVDGDTLRTFVINR